MKLLFARFFAALAFVGSKTSSSMCLVGMVFIGSQVISFSSPTTANAFKKLQQLDNTCPERTAKPRYTRNNCGEKIKAALAANDIAEASRLIFNHVRLNPAIQLHSNADLRPAYEKLLNELIKTCVTSDQHKPCSTVIEFVGASADNCTSWSKDQKCLSFYKAWAPKLEKSLKTGCKQGQATSCEELYRRTANKDVQLAAAKKGCAVGGDELCVALAITPKIGYSAADQRRLLVKGCKNEQHTGCHFGIDQHYKLGEFKWADHILANACRFTDAYLAMASLGSENQSCSRTLNLLTEHKQCDRAVKVLGKNCRSGLACVHMAQWLDCPHKFKAQLPEDFLVPSKNACQVGAIINKVCTDDAVRKSQEKGCLNTGKNCSVVASLAKQRGDHKLAVDLLTAHCTKNTSGNCRTLEYLIGMNKPRLFDLYEQLCRGSKRRCETLIRQATHISKRKITAIGCKVHQDMKACKEKTTATSRYVKPVTFPSYSKFRID